MVNAALAVEDFNGPYCSMRDEHPSGPEVHVAVVEPARRMAWKLY